MKTLRRAALLFSLVLALAWGQQALLLHELGHVAGSLAHPQDPAKPAPAKCADCGLFAQLGTAVAGKAPVAPFVVAAFVLALVLLPRSASLAPRRAFPARAPPFAS